MIHMMCIFKFKLFHFRIKYLFKAYSYTIILKADKSAQKPVYVILKLLRAVDDVMKGQNKSDVGLNLYTDESYLWLR